MMLSPQLSISSTVLMIFPYNTDEIPQRYCTDVPKGNNTGLFDNRKCLPLKPMGKRVTRYREAKATFTQKRIQMNTVGFHTVFTFRLREDADEYVIV